VALNVPIGVSATVDLTDQQWRVACSANGQGHISRRSYETPNIAAYPGPYGRSPRFRESTLALAVSRVLHWPVLDKDTLKSPLLLAGISEEVAAGTAYELLFALAREILVEQHISVILDSPARFPIILERATELAQAAGARLKLVRCLQMIS
jgi:hypothetical protein